MGNLHFSRAISSVTSIERSSTTKDAYYYQITRDSAQYSPCIKGVLIWRKPGEICRVRTS